MPTLTPNSLQPDTTDSDKMLLQKIAASEARALGALGSLVISDTAAHAGTFCCIVPLLDTVFSALVGNLTGFAGVTFPAGIPIYGVFTNVTLTSGAVVAYNG